MRPSRRFAQSKKRHASKFRKQVGRTRPVNLRGAVMRGGIRL